MDLYVAISIDEGSYAGDLTKLDLPALLAKALAEKLAGEIDVPPEATNNCSRWSAP